MGEKLTVIIPKPRSKINSKSTADSSNFSWPGGVFFSQLSRQGVFSDPRKNRNRAERVSAGPSGANYKEWECCHMTKKQERIRIFFIRRKWWSAAACLCLGAAMFYVVNYPAAVGVSSTARQLPIYCVQRDQKMLSISFDAAWGDVILRQLNCKEERL